MFARKWVCERNIGDGLRIAVDQVHFEENYTVHLECALNLIYLHP